MAYIDLKTFDILEKKSPFADASVFECDEEMTGVICLLNRKGYRTKFCCSGHLYDEISDTCIEEDASLSEEELRERYPGILRITPYPDGSRQLTLRQSLSLKSYVMFEDGIILPSVPDEWRYDANVLSHNYYWDSTFSEIRDLKELKEKPFIFYKRRAELLAFLYDWAEKLPVYDSEKAAMNPPAPETMMKQTYRNGPLL